MIPDREFRAFARIGREVVVADNQSDTSRRLIARMLEVPHDVESVIGALGKIDKRKGVDGGIVTRIDDTFLVGGDVLTLDLPELSNMLNVRNNTVRHLKQLNPGEKIRKFD